MILKTWSVLWLLWWAYYTDDPLSLIDPPIIQGILNYPFGGSKQCEYIVILEDFPYNSAIVWVGSLLWPFNFPMLRGWNIERCNGAISVVWYLDWWLEWLDVSMVYRWTKKTHGEVSIPNKSRNNNIRETISSKKHAVAATTLSSGANDGCK